MNLKALAFAALLVGGLPIVSEAACDAGCMRAEVEAYFDGLDAISRSGSTPEDVDALMERLHGGVRYVHVEYEADFTREQWRQAFLGNLERGAYANGFDDEIRVLRSIPGKRHLAVEYSHGHRLPDGSWTATERLLVLFGFTDGRISLVKELW
jgi:hypothetical protein